MRCISCQRFITKSASPSMVIGPRCLRKAMPQPKRRAMGEGKGRELRCAIGTNLGKAYSES